MDQRLFPVGLLDLVSGGRAAQVEDLVVVFALGLLQLQFGLLKETAVLVTAVQRVHLENREQRSAGDRGRAVVNSSKRYTSVGTRDWSGRNVDTCLRQPRKLADIIKTKENYEG